MESIELKTYIPSIEKLSCTLKNSMLHVGVEEQVWEWEENVP